MTTRRPPAEDASTEPPLDAAQVRSLVSRSGDAAAIVDDEGTVLFAAGACPTLLRCSPERAGGRRLDSFFVPAERAALAGALADVIRNRLTERQIQLSTDADPARRLELHLWPGASPGTACVAVSDTAGRELERRRLAALGEDFVTGLPSRLFVNEQIEALLAEHTGVTIVFVGIDRFRTVNETLGHGAGDLLLRALAGRLRAHAGPATVVHWSGDTFAVVVRGLARADVEAYCERLRETIRTPVRVGRRELRVTASIGVALSSEHGHRADALLASADRALARAKDGGRNRTAFASSVTSSGADPTLLQARLGNAIEHDAIGLHYQPIVRASDGRIVGVEALARWNDAELGPVSPGVFVPLAEHLGLMTELNARLSKKALAQLALWRADHHAVRLSINVSRQQLIGHGAVEALVAQVRKAGLAPADVVVEITESTAMHDLQEQLGQLVAFAAAGFALSIDDFGTGYSSLSQLHLLPLHEMKIDLSFVRRLHTPAGARIVETIIQLGRNLGLELVAEGVEDAVTAERLRALGVDLLQGYHLGRPVPASEITARLAKRPA